MSILPAIGVGHRVSLDRGPAPVHSSTDPFKHQFHPSSKLSLKAFQEEYSALRKIRGCGINRQPCGHALCALCSPKRQRRYRRQLVAALKAAQPSYAIFWTATVGSLPGGPLGPLWSQLDDLLAAVNKGQWLARRADGYARAIEIERTPGGWHPHAHTLLIFRNELTRPEAQKIARAIQARYLRAADLRGISASPEGQHIRVIPLSQLSTVVDYMTKATMQNGDPRDPGTVTPAMLLRQAAHGDADALVHLNELEHASYRRRTWQTGGILRSGERG